MMRLLEVAFCLSIVSIVSAQTDLHAFDCRKTTNTCQNGGTCEATGVCTCTGTKQNYDCSDDSSTDAGSNTCGCVTGKCKTDGSCVCPETHYGAKCDQETIQAICGISGKILVNVNVPNITNIQVYRYRKRDRCSITAASGGIIPTDWAGKSRAISVPTDIMCGNAVPKSLNGKHVGYCVDLIIRHMNVYLTMYDSKVTFCCVDTQVTKSVGYVNFSPTTTTTTTATTPVQSGSILHQASYIVTVISAFLISVV